MVADKAGILGRGDRCYQSASDVGPFAVLQLPQALELDTEVVRELDAQAASEAVVDPGDPDLQALVLLCIDGVVVVAHVALTGGAQASGRLAEQAGEGDLQATTELLAHLHQH